MSGGSSDCARVTRSESATTSHPPHDRARIRTTRQLAPASRQQAIAAPPELGYWTWLLDGEVVGLGHLQPARDLPAELIETGWCVRPDLWRQGLATEAIRSLLDYALSDLRLPAVWALVDSENAPSIRFAHRLGFLSVGERPLDEGTAQVFVRPADSPL
ncbi:GNAT family N-acetyltransferase [Streptomyces sp. NPDC050528]|uniref:GNAT family N-acetyltransferase n=1 Tax=Streptomyces sp. NPDC050528 TaxID=3365623 RepID=UPI0037AF9C5C